MPDEPMYISSWNLASSTINLPNEPVEVDEPLMFPNGTSNPLLPETLSKVVEPDTILKSVSGLLSRFTMF